MVDDGDAIAHLVRLSHVVRCEQYGSTRLFCLKGTDTIAHIARSRDVETDGRLIKEENPWVVEERSCKVQLLALTG